MNLKDKVHKTIETIVTFNSAPPHASAEITSTQFGLRVSNVCNYYSLLNSDRYQKYQVITRVISRTALLQNAASPLKTKHKERSIFLVILYLNALVIHILSFAWRHAFRIIGFAVIHYSRQLSANSNDKLRPKCK